MAGAFNANILKEAHKSIDEFGKEKSDIICIGKKAVSYLKNRNYANDKDYRDEFKNWIETIWAEKDKKIEELKF